MMMVYRRNIRPNMLRCLVKLYRNHGIEAVETSQLETEAVKIADFPKLRFWGLIEGVGKLKWRMTRKGVDFICRNLLIKKYVWVYDNEVQSDPVGERNPLISAREIDRDLINSELVLKNARPVMGFAHPEFDFTKSGGCKT